MAELATWKARHEACGAEPIEALKLWFEAVFLYLEPDSRDLGRGLLQYLTIPFKQDTSWDRRPSNGTFVARMKDARHHHIFRSYARDSLPENGYRLDPASWQLAVERSVEDPHGRGWTVAVRSSGADSARPVYLKKSTKTGLYFVDKHANVYVGVRPPQDPDAESFV